MKSTLNPREWLFSVMGLLIGLVLWWLLINTINASTNLSNNWPSFVTFALITLVIFGVWLGWLSLSTLLLSTPMFIGMTFLLSAGGLLLSGGLAVSSIGVVLFFAALVYFRFHIRRISENELRFRPVSMMRRSIGVVITAVLLVASLMVYSNLARGTGSETNTISTLSVGVGNLANQLLPAFLPDYKPGQTLDEFLISAALQGMKNKPGFEQDLPPELRDRLEQGIAIEEVANLIPKQDRDNLRSEFLKPFGLNDLPGDTPMTVVIQRIVDAKAQEWLKPVASFIPPFIAVGVFLLLNVFRWLVLGLGAAWLSLISRFLLATSIVSIRTEQRKKEILALPE